MEEMERDFVTFTDDDGNDFELDVIDYFEYEGQEYAVLMDLSEECEHDEDEECDCGHDVYIMKIVVNGDMEDEQNALIVRDIAVSESGVSAENVKIISAAK